MTTVLQDIVAKLEGLNYQVNLLPQEKLKPTEIVITLADLVLTIESTTSYKLKPSFDIMLQSSNVPDIIVRTISIIKELTKLCFTNFSFGFDSASLKRYETLYEVHLMCTYIEVINFG